MSRKSTNPAPHNKHQRSKIGECLGQMLRLILYTSVVWNVIVNKICESLGSGNENLMKEIIIAALFALWIIVYSVLYGTMPGAKWFSLRLLLPAFFLFFCNIFCLCLIWARDGTDSFLFKSSVILSALSVIVFFADLIYYIVSVAGQRKSKEAKALKKERHNARNASIRRDAANAMELPKGIVRRVTKLLLIVVALIYLLFILLPMRGHYFIDIPIIPLILHMFFGGLVSIALGFRLYALILSRDKYVRHKADDEEETHE